MIFTPKLRVINLANYGPLVLKFVHTVIEKVHCKPHSVYVIIIMTTIIILLTSVRTRYPN